MISAEYISHMGSDLTVCNSARVSFDKSSELSEDKTLYPKDVKLIEYLAKHKHFSPFTHPQIILRETVPIFVARQRFKHIVGFSYNEVSRRYVDDTPKFFTPSSWRARPEGSVKQGSEGEHLKSNEYQARYAYFVERAKALYEDMIFDGIAPEQARMILPQSMMTSYYVTGSLAAFARVYNLRTDSHAQEEIQVLAGLIAAIIAPLFPISWTVLVEHYH